MKSQGSFFVSTCAYTLTCSLFHSGKYFRHNVVGVLFSHVPLVCRLAIPACTVCHNNVLYSPFD